MMTREELETALEVFHTDPADADRWLPEDYYKAYRTLGVAAGKQLALMPEKCGTCGGEGTYDWSDYRSPGPCPICHGSGKVYPPETVEKIAKAVGEMFLYPDPHNEGNWMGPGIQASRQVAIAVLDALGETE